MYSPSGAARNALTGPFLAPPKHDLAESKPCNARTSGYRGSGSSENTFLDSMPGALSRPRTLAALLAALRLPLFVAFGAVSERSPVLIGARFYDTAPRVRVAPDHTQRKRRNRLPALPLKYGTKQVCCAVGTHNSASWLGGGGCCQPP